MDEASYSRIGRGGQNELTKIENLEERVQQLSERQRREAHEEFARRWYQLSENEQALGREVLDEFGVLRDSGQMTTEAQAEKWFAGLTADKRAVMERLPAWDDKH
jgi:preprotein translocase subunit SecA